MATVLNLMESTIIALFVIYSFILFCVNNKNYKEIFRQIFVMEIYKPRLLPSNAARLHTNLTEFH